MISAQQRLAAVAVLALSPLLAVPAAATVVVDNLTESIRDTTVVTESFWAAQSFGTGTASGLLDPVTLVLGSLIGGPVISATVHGPGGPASAAIGTLTVPPLSTTQQLPESLMPAAPISLAAGTLYWLVLTAAGPGSYGFSYADSNTHSGVGSFGNYEYSTDGGATWENFGSDFPYLAQVSVSAVPEPAAALLAMLGLAAIVTRRRFGMR